MPKRRSRPCPCGPPMSYEDCCGRLHRGEARAKTAEELMRSRFSAFDVRNAAYLIGTWHPTTRPPSVGFETGLQWQDLEILGTADGSPFNAEGTVEFRARFTQRGQAGELHEVSRFVRHEGAWVYLNGQVT